MKIVNMYETADRKVWATEQQAFRHESDLLLGKIDRLLIEYFPAAHRPSSTKAVLSMVENKELFKNQLREILYLLEN
jgi:hypothetical protein